MRRCAFIVGVAGAAAVAAFASADVIFTCQVFAFDQLTNQQIGEKTFQFQVPANANPNDPVSAGWGAWQFGPGNSDPGTNPTAWDLGNGTRIHGVGVEFRNDPQVSLNFNVASGISNTTFVVNSSIVSFAPLSPAQGYASAFIGVTDSALLGTPGQITLTGLQPGGKAYSALYNPSLTDFADLISGGAINMAPGSSTSFTDNFGSAGSPVAIGGSLSEIRSQFRFALSAGDRAAGTSTFDVVPAPAAATLLGLGGLFAARRRRA